MDINLKTWQFKNVSLVPADNSAYMQNTLRFGSKLVKSNGKLRRNGSAVVRAGSPCTRRYSPPESHICNHLLSKSSLIKSIQLNLMKLELSIKLKKKKKVWKQDTEFVISLVCRVSDHKLWNNVTLLGVKIIFYQT